MAPFGNTYLFTYISRIALALIGDALVNIY